MGEADPEALVGLGAGISQPEGRADDRVNASSWLARLRALSPESGLHTGGTTGQGVRVTVLRRPGFVKKAPAGRSKNLRVVFAEGGRVLVSGSVTVEVVCHHAGAGGGEPLVVLRCAVARDLEPSLKDTLRGGGRVFVNGIRVDPDDGVMINGILRLARESGFVPAVKRELWCPCGLTVEVSEPGFRQALTRLAEREVTQAELVGFDR